MLRGLCVGQGVGGLATAGQGIHFCTLTRGGRGLRPSALLKAMFGAPHILPQQPKCPFLSSATLLSYSATPGWQQKLYEHPRGPWGTLSGPGGGRKAGVWVCRCPSPASDWGPQGSEASASRKVLCPGPVRPSLRRLKPEVTGKHRAWQDKWDFPSEGRCVGARPTSRGTNLLVAAGGRLVVHSAPVAPSYSFKGPASAGPSHSQSRGPAHHRIAGWCPSQE